MKNLIRVAFLALITCSVHAQNKNVLKATETKTTTVKNSQGEKKIISTNETKEIQNIELEEAKPNTLNIPMKESPVMVTQKTELSVDGKTKYFDVDHSAYYMYNDKKYQVKGDEYGYSLSNSDSKKNSYLRKTSNNNYIFVNDGKVSSAYFDELGNLIIDTYNEKTDRITTEKYMISK
ncbi:hypothetical protein [Flavobacterium sp.]